MIASNLAGAYFKKFPDEIDSVIIKWAEDENIWLKRTAILFQLKYKEETDKALLANLSKKEAIRNINL